MKAFYFVLPVSMLVACTSASSDNEYPKRGSRMPNFEVSNFDTNQDDKVSPTEFLLSDQFSKGRGPSKEMFDRIDKNGDGYLTQDEFDGMKAKRGRKGTGRRR